MSEEKQVTLKMSFNELSIDKIAHQFVIEKTFQADMATGVPEHIAREEAMRKSYAHVKRIEDIDQALKALVVKKKKPLVEPDEEEYNEDDE